MQYLDNAMRSLEIDNEKDYKKASKSLIQTIDKLDYKLRGYMIKVIEKAKVHKASRLHEHGISVGRTAEILGV